MVYKDATKQKVKIRQATTYPKAIACMPEKNYANRKNKHRMPKHLKMSLEKDLRDNNQVDLQIHMWKFSDKRGKKRRKQQFHKWLVKSDRMG